jgi:2,5-furandicarboxylate decarboxylase 1
VTIREFIASEPDLIRVDEPVSSHLEAAGIIAGLDGKAVLLTNVDGGRQVLSGFTSGRERIAHALGVSGVELLHLLARALENPQPPSVVDRPPCQEVVLERPDLTRLPILKHLADDGGPYVTAGVSVVNDPEYGRNISYHRLMVIGERQFVARVVEGRGTHTAWSRTQEDLPIAVAIGCPLSVLLAAAMSPAKGVDEYSIAQAIRPTPLARCLTVPLEVPAEAEYVIEGRLTHRLADEGPFIDLTETWDGVRPQPVLEVDCITHRRDPIYHAILPGLSEHKTIMGLPREPGILTAVGRVCDVLDVGLTVGGMSWLHALVRIRKRHRDDGPAAIRATLEGHPSVKHVVVVDEDVDLSDLHRVEWAIATRVQAGRDVYIFRDQPSSSLDPSSRQIPGRRGLTDKLGIDATIPWPDTDDPEEIERHVSAFRRVSYPEVHRREGNKGQGKKR